MTHALHDQAPPRLRTWLARQPVVADYERVARALFGGPPLDEPRSERTWGRPEPVWRALLASQGIPERVFEHLVVPVAQLARAVKPKGEDYADLSDDVVVAAGLRVLGMLATRDRAQLLDTLHARNKMSRRFFAAVTGETSVDAWLARVGVDVAAIHASEAAAREAAKAAEAARAVAAKEAAKEARVADKLSALVRFNLDGTERVGSHREFLDAMIAAGYRRIEPRRDGLATEWWLVNDATCSSVQAGGTIARDYAVDAVERRTGSRPVVPILHPVTSYSVRLGQYDLRKPPGEVMFKGRTKKHFAGKPQDTKKEAVARVDQDAASYESTGHRVIERAVVGYEQAGYPPRKWYVPVVVLAEDS